VIQLSIDLLGMVKFSLKKKIRVPGVIPPFLASVRSGVKLRVSSLTKSFLRMSNRNVRDLFLRALLDLHNLDGQLVAYVIRLYFHKENDSLNSSAEQKVLTL